jgi:LmbE family N-acetylglucosaminyl deacetylase
MAQKIKYSRRVADKVISSTDISEVFPQWKGEKECWMFVSAHDDDIICGGGLTFLSGLEEGIETHAVVTTDGRMGYCRPQQRRTISKIREEECRGSFQVLGLPKKRLHFLKFPDCNLNSYRGRHFTTIGDPTEMDGASGLQNAYSHVLREVRPTRVFLPTISDLHPDHRIVNLEMLISLFHAQGKIWPELGDPITDVPMVYEYATYCDFPEAPTLRIETSEEMLERKLNCIMAYKSQEQIDVLIDVQREAGTVEYIREIEFEFLTPKKYEDLFEV